MKTAQDIILKPLVTERSTMDAAFGRYTFIVARDATKPEIGQACETLFQVKVLKVNTMNYDGKKKRMNNRIPGRTTGYKKAIVTIDQDPDDDQFLSEGGKVKSAGRKYKNTIEEFGFGQ